jgi:small subunit ribosomal protein S4
MGRHSEPSCKKCRREGERLLLKGDRCAGSKCAMLRRPYPPGVHGKAIKKYTDYGVRLREKQRAARFYGLSGRQLSRYYQIADKKTGVTGLIFLQLLEIRLDNIIYRMGLASSRNEARQKVKHGHFLINGKKVNIPSYSVKPNEVVALREKSLKSFQVVLEKMKEKTWPEWVSFNPDKKEGTMNSLPKRDDIDVPVSEQLIVEFYSKF